MNDLQFWSHINGLLLLKSTETMVSSMLALFTKSVWIAHKNITSLTYRIAVALRNLGMTALQLSILCLVVELALKFATSEQSQT